MALTDDLKILDNRIKANQAQHDLGRETTKISVLSSKYLRKIRVLNWCRFEEFEEMSLYSKHNRIKEFNKLLIKLKALKSRNSKTQLKKERIMKNVGELYEKY